MTGKMRGIRHCGVCGWRRWAAIKIGGIKDAADNSQPLIEKIIYHSYKQAFLREKIRGIWSSLSFTSESNSKVVMADHPVNFMRNC